MGDQTTESALDDVQPEKLRALIMQWLLRVDRSS